MNIFFIVYLWVIIYIYNLLYDVIINENDLLWFSTWKAIFDMDKNKEWYVFLKETDMGINDHVYMKIISHLEK